MERDGKNIVAFGKRPGAAKHTPADLPDPQGRWVWRQKVKVVTAVNTGILSLDEACKRYAMSVEEFREWEISYFCTQEHERGVSAARTVRIAGKDSK